MAEATWQRKYVPEHWTWHDGPVEPGRAVVVDLIREKKRRGVAIVGIFHDDDVRAAVADRIVDVTSFAPSRQPAESAEAAP